MLLVSILATAWLVSAPALGTVSLSRHTPAATSTQAPTSAPADATPATPKGEPSGAKPEASDNAAKTKAEGAPAGQRARGRRVRKPAQPGEPRKKVVREGGATEPSAKIVPGVAPQQASQERQNTEGLLSLTEEKLKTLADRRLDGPRQETVAQIHNYVEGARSALKDGDTQRAHTLALKAHLLADDLLKR
jgi:hypothetical protein